MKWLPLLFLFVWTIQASRAANPAHDARDRLSQSKEFSFGGIGPGATISSSQKDYEEVLGRKTALTDFQWILQKGTPAAKCYALNGIFVLDAGLYKKLSPSFITNRSEFITRSGCMGHNSSLSIMLSSIERGEYRTVPGEKSYPSPPGSLEEMYALLERKIPSLHFENTPGIEALNQIYVEGKLKFNRVPIQILSPDKVIRTKTNLMVKDISTHDALRVYCHLNGLGYTLSERGIFIFDPSMATNLESLLENNP